MSEESPQFLAALRDFRQARQRAILERILARLRQQSAELLDYDDVREKLHAGAPIDRGLRDIPLDAIVGSVGRYADFTRSFLPRRKSAERRWAEVKAALPNVETMPPITVYQVGEAYFVLDGNHRVSIARQAGASHIRAFVTEIETRVPLDPDVQPDELICKEKYADFLEITELDRTRPEADFQVTAPGQYRVLLDLIAAYRQQLAREGNDTLTLPEAAARWYDVAYRPVIRLIRERAILRHFPDRTETDLYTWIARHRAEIGEFLGWDVQTDAAADDLVSRYSLTPQQLLSRVKERIKETLTPEPLETGPAPGWWRRTHGQADHLFQHILVPMSLRETGWRTFEQALVVVHRDPGRLHGLHVRRPTARVAPPAELESRFRARCETEGVAGDFSTAEGKGMDLLLQHARWADLVVYTIARPPHDQPLGRLSSNFHTLVRQAPCPLLVVPGIPAPLARALVAYDGSVKAKEALFVSAYLAGKWQIPLTVLTVSEAERVADEVLEHARAYLEGRGVPATFVAEEGPALDAIRRTAEAHACDFVVMGGYGFQPVLEVVLGSLVDEVLRLGRWPVLICR